MKHKGDDRYLWSAASKRRFAVFLHCPGADRGKARSLHEHQPTNRPPDGFACSVMGRHVLGLKPDTARGYKDVAKNRFLLSASERERRRRDCECDMHHKRIWPPGMKAHRILTACVCVWCLLGGENCFSFRLSECTDGEMRKMLLAAKEALGWSRDSLLKDSVEFMGCDLWGEKINPAAIYVRRLQTN